MKILLPVDGSEGALSAVHHALALVRGGLRATFVLANVQEPASLYEVVIAHDADVLERVSAAAADHSLSAAQALLRSAGVDLDIEIGSGDPGHTLLDIAERFGVALVIMGARGVGQPQSAALGSVAAAVLHGARIPVTIVSRARD